MVVFSLKMLILHVGWKLKPFPQPYILCISENEKHEQLYELKAGKNICIQISSNEPKFCIGFNNENGQRFSCPNLSVISGSKVQCQYCSLNDFYNCRAICQGNFCQPSSESAREYCWKTTVYIYLTFVGGDIKVGTSTNPLRRWLEQGSDAGVCVGAGVGLEPRALEQQISLKLSLKKSVRLNQKLKQLGRGIDKDFITQKLLASINTMYSIINTPFLFSPGEEKKVQFLDEYYGQIPFLPARPFPLSFNILKGLTVSGEIFGVKGSFLVIKNNETYNVINLFSLIGYHIEISENLVAMKGQKSLFDFV